MSYEDFKEAFSELDVEDMVSIFNEYCREYGNCDNEIFEFDDSFFDEFFEGRPADAVRACFFGDIKNWSDEYIYFNAYANLESLSKYEVEDYVSTWLDEIYEHKDIWEDYIDDDEDEE